MCVHANAAPRAVWAPKAALCSGTFRSHDIIYGLSEALWTLGLAISLECLKVAVRCIESRVICYVLF